MRCTYKQAAGSFEIKNISLFLYLAWAAAAEVESMAIMELVVVFGGGCCCIACVTAWLVVGCCW